MANRQTYLSLIQGVVNRLSNNSFLLKGWSVILVAGLFSLSDIVDNGSMILLAYFPAISFWGLDAYYLRQERLYRKLYESVRENEHDVNFSMNVSSFEKEVDYQDVLFSKTLVLFHGVLLFTLICVTALTIIGDLNGA